MAANSSNNSSTHHDEIILNRIKQEYNEFQSRERKKEKSNSKYHGLYLSLKNLILSHKLPESSNLPATRILASELGLSRSTINKALELLIMESLVETRLGSGTYVKERLKHSKPKKQILRDEAFPRLSELGESFSSSVSLINSTDDKSIAFRPGIPPLDLFPVTHWKNLSNLYWRHIRTSEMIYSPSSGLLSVKKSIASYLNITRNIQCNPEHIFIVAGSLQSLYLVGSVLVNPNDEVIIENPGFPNVRAIFKGLRASITNASIDAEGMVLPDRKEEENNLKLIHCTPSCQYPLGMQMSLRRRKELLEFARDNKALIIENDYEHEINNSSGSLPSLYELDGGERTIYLGTFNRLLHPSIRIGYMVVPEYLMHAMESLLKHSHRFVPPSLQVVLSQFIDRKYIYKHIKKVNQSAISRKEVFVKAFHETFPSYARLSDSQTPSLHTLAYLQDGHSDKEIVELLNKHHLICHPLSKCYSEKDAEQGLLFGYSSVRSPMIKNKVMAMSKLIKEHFT